MARTAAHAFSPGEYPRDELEERGWTVAEFAEIIGQSTQAVSEFLDARKETTAETAMTIAAALGTTPEVWLNLQTRYRLHQSRAAS